MNGNEDKDSDVGFLMSYTFSGVPHMYESV